jgi:hypothetical protein
MEMESESMVIFSGRNLWFSEGDIKTGLNPIGKAKGLKKAPAKTRASAKAGPEIINPLFEQMSGITDDPFWKTTLQEAAIGKFPRGFVFSNDTLHYKTRHCTLSGPSIQHNLGLVVNFMQSTAAIMSNRDLEVRNQELIYMMSQNVCDSYESWGKIKSIQDQALLVAKFVTILSESHHLNDSEEKQLEETIRLGIFIKCFNSNTIKVSNSQIVHIDGLLRRTDGKFDLDMRLCAESRTTKRPTKLKTSGFNIMKSWSKFVDGRFKRVTNEGTVGVDDLSEDVSPVTDLTTDT